MAECFADSFASIFASGVPAVPAPHQQCFNLMEDFFVTPLQVAELLESLDHNSSMGADLIHPRLLKSLSLQLSVPLCIILTHL